MAKKDSTFICDPALGGCGAQLQRMRPTCVRCKAVGTVNEVTVAADAQQAGLKSSGAATPTKQAKTIRDIQAAPIERFETGIGELDRVLGGGFVAGSVVLLGGQPGSGKSTVSLSIAEKFALKDFTVLYSSGEESDKQIGMRAERMGIEHENIKIVNETNLESLLGHIDIESPDFVIVDSLQTLASSAVTGTVGSISQSLECAHALTRVAKDRGITMLLINQVTK